MSETNAGQKEGYVFVENAKLDELKARAEALGIYKKIAEEANYKIAQAEIQAYQKVITMLIRELSHPLILKNTKCEKETKI